MKFAEKISEVVEAKPVIKKVGLGVGIAAAVAVTGVVVYKLGNTGIDIPTIVDGAVEAAPEVAETVAEVAENVVA